MPTVWTIPEWLPEASPPSLPTPAHCTRASATETRGCWPLLLHSRGALSRGPCCSLDASLARSRLPGLETDKACGQVRGKEEIKC